ncbi:unnamed protein product [Ceratitis capitata]|uniref:(Mediterranean fruit fly) hypothetical protein n=1 Tax=Ceratitis capitata TaxID=7213 RepID=A0A811UNE6_CERCA|nr:unnamed protein product [Ceratitis capitata]
MPLLRRVFRNLLDADNYYKSIQPLFFCTQILGLTSYVVSTNKSGVKSLTMSALSHIVALVQLVGFAYSSAYVVYFNATYIGQFLNTDITNGGEKSIVLASGATAVVVLITNFVRRRRLLWVLEYFPRIDKSFQRIGICWNYTKVLHCILSKIVFMICVLSIAFGIYVCCWRRLDVYPPLPIIFMSLNQQIGIYFTILLFSFVMLSTRVRMQALNKVLNFGEASDRRSQGHPQLTSVSFRLI